MRGIMRCGLPLSLNLSVLREEKFLLMHVTKIGQVFAVYFKSIDIEQVQIQDCTALGPEQHTCQV